MKKLFMSIILFAGAMLSVVSCSPKKTESDPILATEINIDKCLDQAVEQYAVGYLVGKHDGLRQKTENCALPNDSVLKKQIEGSIPVAYSVVRSLNEVVNPENEIQKHYLLSWLLNDSTHTEQYVRLSYRLKYGVITVSKISSGSYFDAVKTAIADITGDFSAYDYDTEELLKAAVERFEQRKKEKKNPVSYEVIKHSYGGCVINYTLADGTTTEVHSAWGLVVEDGLEYTLPEF